MATDTHVREILESLILAAGVSGNEQPVAAVLERQLAVAGYPQDALQADRLGNRWLEAGPPGEPQRLLVAHMDEIGLRITSVKGDGRCQVAPIGGIDPQLWEGTAVVVHTADGPVPGCIAPQSLHVTNRQGHGHKHRIGVNELCLETGADSADDVAELGIRLLDPITWQKSFTPLANGYVQARSLDDRFGCAALSVVAGELLINPPNLPTVLAWSVQEEVGLRGARELAARFPELREVIAVDSFTVGLGPHDNRQFDGPRPGLGPVLRSWDSTTLVPDQTRRALLKKAEALDIPLQYGFMPGGNDASMFHGCDALTFALGVCVQYSHTAVERCHLGDVVQLSDLLSAWCATPCP